MDPSKPTRHYGTNTKAWLSSNVALWGHLFLQVGSMIYILPGLLLGTWNCKSFELLMQLIATMMPLPCRKP
jgi:hypothetical protein